MLTTTNEEAMQLSYLLQKRGLHTRLVQSLGGFQFYHLAEIRYFLKQFPVETGKTLSREQWEEAKNRTLKQYGSSKCIEAVKVFFKDYEETHRTLYYSDLVEFLLESNIEDFITADQRTVFISTIHKAKGREFDTVHLVALGLRETEAMLHALYVGITRAKKQLVIHSDNKIFSRLLPPTIHHVVPNEHVPVSVALSYRDVYLDFFKDKKSLILKLRGGDPLRYEHSYLFTMKGECVASLSKTKREEIERLEGKGYQVTEGEVDFIVAWSPKGENQEYAVCLATLYLKSLVSDKKESNH